MPKFSYIVKDSEGKTYKNISDEVSQKSLVEKLQKQNYFVVNLEEISPSNKKILKKKKKKGKSFSHKKIKTDDLLTFSRQLGTMLESGVTLIRSINVILSQIESKNFYAVMSTVKNDIEQGIALSAALSRHPNVFNQFWVSLLEVGEAAGTIPNVLEKLTFYIEQQEEFKATIISGIIYPAILFIVACGAILFFALFVGPRFEAIFTQMGVKLPLITVILLSTFNFIKKFFFMITVVVIVLVFLLKKYTKTYKGRLLKEKFLFNLPIIGDVYRSIIVERFSSQMAILIDTGVPILYALDITEKLVNNNCCALIVADIREGVKSGELLVAPMERSEFFPPLCIQMIMVGEETGELSKMLNHVAAYYQKIVERFMKRFATIVEPFMLIFMGGVIGTIVLAMFMPMFNIAQLGGG